MTQPKLLDTVALLQDIPAEWLTLVEPDHASVTRLPSGLIGTVVEGYDREQIPHDLIECADSQGSEYAMAVLQAHELLLLHPELTFV